MSEVLTKELIDYLRTEAVKYGPPHSISTELPSGLDMPLETWLKLLYAAEVGLAMDEKMLHLLNRFGIAVEALEKIQHESHLCGPRHPVTMEDWAEANTGHKLGKIATEALAKLELP